MYIIDKEPIFGVKPVVYITPKEASAKWGISECRIQGLCEEGRIEGVYSVQQGVG